MNQDKHCIYFTDNTIIIELNSIIMNGTLETKYFGLLRCKISINVSTCNILASIHINKYLVNLRARGRLTEFRFDVA